MISVITPSLNQGRYIERTIQSVLSQKDVDVELIVVDGGSSDNTLDILKKYRHQLRWTSKKDHGQAAAVNKGIAASRGETIGWLNSDDIYSPGALSRVADFFHKNPNVDIVYGDAWLIDSQDRIIGTYPTETWNVHRLHDICYLCQPAVFFRRTLVERFGLLDENLIYCMDYEYWLRLAQNGIKFAYLPHVLAGSRIHPDTKTLARRMPAHRETLSMLGRKLGRAPDRWVAGYSRVMAEEKGFGSEQRPVRHVLYVLYFTMDTAIRFNRKISPGIVLLTLRWIFTGIRSAYRQILRESGK